jgi:hypothetical protein
MTGSASGVTCRSCDEIQHTSPDQVFWRCRWHCEEPGGEVTRCHVLPGTPACVHHHRSPVKAGTALRGPALVAAREVESGVPAWVALACAGLAVAS